MIKKLILAGIVALSTISAASATDFICGGILKEPTGDTAVAVVGRFDENYKLTDDIYLIANEQLIYNWATAESKIEADGKTWKLVAIDYFAGAIIIHPEGEDNKTEIAFIFSDGSVFEIKNGNCRFSN